MFSWKDSIRASKMRSWDPVGAVVWDFGWAAPRAKFERGAHYTEDCSIAPRSIQVALTVPDVVVPFFSLDFTAPKMDCTKIGLFHLAILHPVRSPITPGP